MHDPAGTVTAPKFSLALQPARPTGDPDSNYANSGWASEHLKSAAKNWADERMKTYAAKERVLIATTDAAGLSVSLPADIATDIYRVMVRGENIVEPSSGQAETPVRIVQPGASANLSLFIPRVRTVFQQGESIELNVILRSVNLLPAGSVTFTLAPRQGEAVDFQPDGWRLSTVSIPAGPSRTFTYRLPAAGLQAGRYLLQIEGVFAALTLRDTWPLQIVDPTPETRFRLMFAQWSAGYTHIWEPFTGEGMRNDSKRLADEGLNLYDSLFLNKASQPSFRPVTPEASWLTAAMDQAAMDPSMPAPEKYLQPVPLEIELQEALRNKLQVQRDIQGSHELTDWGWGNPLSIARDNRRIRNWTQWQREYPSWIGHRYQTLSWSVPGEEAPLRTSLEAQGLVIPSDQELVWARNNGQRSFITDSESGISSASGVAADTAGNVYVVHYNGRMTKYGPDGKVLWRRSVTSGSLDIAVATDGTIIVAQGNAFTLVDSDGKTANSYHVDAGPWSPRGLGFMPDGTVLLSSSDKRILHYSRDGKKLGEFGTKESLSDPGGVVIANDGTIYVANGNGTLAIFNNDFTPRAVLSNRTSSVFGGKADVAVAPDGTIWTTHYSMLSHWTAAGELIAHVGKGTLAPGGFSQPMSVAVLPNGNLLEGDSARPFAQQITPEGDPVAMYGIDNLLLDARTDRTRYNWKDTINVNLFAPLPTLTGKPGEHLQAFVRLAGQNDAPWQPLPVQELGSRDFRIIPPQLEGKITLRLVWAVDGATADAPQRAEMGLELAKVTPPADMSRLADIMNRQRVWQDARVGGRMHRVLEFTELTNELRPGSQNTCPTNFGSQDFIGGGVWEPWRLPGLVAVANNPGTDAGEFPLHAPWYIADGLIGPTIKPAWANLLSWHWNNDSRLHRPLRDVFLLLGAGASGIGGGELLQAMSPAGLAAHRRFIGWLQRVGDATTQLELPGRNGVAVLHSYTQETMFHIDRSHFYSAMSAWGDLLRAHVPTAAISEETIVNQPDTLRRFKAVLLPDIRFPLPQNVMQALEQYRKNGGEVWVDLAWRMPLPIGWKTLNARYFPAAIENVAYDFISGIGAGSYDGNYEYWIWQQQSDSRLPAVHAAFDYVAITPVRTTDPNVYLQQRTGGLATWIFAGNNHFPNAPLYKTYLCGDAPVPATVPFSFQGGVIYDALSGERIQPGTKEITFTDEQPGMIWVVLPRPVGGIQCTLTQTGNELAVTVGLNDEKNIRLAAVVPLELTIADQTGTVLTHLRRSTDATGVCMLKLPLRWPVTPGKWTITVKELLAGKSTTASLLVKTPTAPNLDAVNEPTLIFDRPAISSWLQNMRGKEIWVALDKGQMADEGFRSMAEQLAASLQARGVAAKLVDYSALPRVIFKPGYQPTADEQANIDKVLRGEAIGTMAPSWSWDFATNGPNTVLTHPLLLLGAPAQNSLLREIHDNHMAPRQLSPCYPGPGRALLQHIWSPFYDGSNVITISATDATGVLAGITSLLAFK